MHKNKKKPLNISLTLGDDQTIPAAEQPTNRQIKSVLDTFKRKQYGDEPLTMRQLGDFVNEHMEVPDDEDESFVMFFERSPSSQPDNKYFRRFVTTKRLLRNAAHMRIAHFDATEKIMVEKCYLLVAGTTDMNRAFHLIGITLSSHQDTNSYQFTMNSVKSGIGRIAQVEKNPDFVVADADAAIKLAEKNDFDVPVIICY